MLCEGQLHTRGLEPKLVLTVFNFRAGGSSSVGAGGAWEAGQGLAGLGRDGSGRVRMLAGQAGSSLGPGLARLSEETALRP